MSISKSLLSLASLSAPLDAKAGPYTFQIKGDLPRFQAAPNLTALILSRATMAPVQVVDAACTVVATVDHAVLEAAEREKRLLGERAGRRGREVPLTAGKRVMADLLQRPEGATKAELVQANAGKGVSAWGTTRNLADRLGLVAAKDLNAEPPRFWLKEAAASAPPAAKPDAKRRAA